MESQFFLNNSFQKSLMIYNMIINIFFFQIEKVLKTMIVLLFISIQNLIKFQKLFFEFLFYTRHINMIIIFNKRLQK